MAIAGAAAAALGAGGSILGGMGAQSAATKARRSQEEQFRQSMAHQRWLDQNAYNRTQPWIGAGQDALTNLRSQAWYSENDPSRWYQRGGVDPNAYRWQSLRGVDPNQYGFTAGPTVDPSQYRFSTQPYSFNAEQYRFNADPYTYTPGAVLDPSQYRYTPTESASLGRFDFTPPTVTDDPGYQFRLRQGQQALDASAAARGGLTSGAAMRALTRYGQELGSQEYQAAYGRSWQQQQEAYERSRLANMTQEERQRYADVTGYGRALTANQMADERARSAAAQNYAQQFGANQFNANLGLQAQQQNFARDYQVASDYYNRLVQQQQTGFTQGLATNDLAYQRAVAANQLAESRGLAETQRNWQMDLAANQLGQERAWQEYQAELARRQNVWNQYASLAGLGQVGMSQAQQAANQSGQTMANLFQGLGTAQGTGFINQANAQTGMYSGIAGSVNQGLQNYMLSNYMNNLQTQQQAGPMGFNAAGQRTSGLLPTTWPAYTQGGYGGTQYPAFG